MPKTKRAPLSLSLLLSLAADADNDRPDDAWESANGLNLARTTVDSIHSVINAKKSKKRLDF